MRSRKTSSGWRRGGLSALVLLSSCLTVGRAVAQPSIGVSVDVFDRTLSPYGEWVPVGYLGRVWRPHRALVGLDFRPYLSGGHWVYTDYGWTFESDYEWGWAPFHYGRWFLDDYYGWVWAPDTVWGPAWVDWRFGNGYVGWVPLAPVGFSINYGFYRPAWCFVPVRHFVVRDVYHYALPVDRFHWAYSVTSPIQQPIHHAGAQWNGGPPPGQVSQATGQPIHAASIAPPAPGRVQPVRVASPTGVPVHSTTAPPSSPGSAPPGYAPHPPTSAGPGFVAPAPHAAPPPPATDAHWGNAPIGGSAHWTRVPNPPLPMQSSPHPWVASPGANAPAPHPAPPPPAADAHWGQTPANVTPHWSGGGGPAPSGGRPSFGSSVSPSAPPPAGVGHPISPASRPAPPPAPSIHPSAPVPRPAPVREVAPSPPSGKQGFYSPRIYQGASQIRAAPAGANVARPFGGFSRPSAPVAYRSAFAVRSFASVRRR